MNHIKGLRSIKQRIDETLVKQAKVLIGIDGMAASGKTTLADTLKKYYKAVVIHMDDFFLQDYQKTEDRLEEVDGFIDYERFNEEVIQQLKKDKSLTYHIYNCQTKLMTEEFVDKDYQVIIIEGAYSLRKSFYDIYDIKILMIIDDKLQLTRIEERNQPNLVERFIREWIPRENKYLKRYDLKKSVDFIIMNK